MRYSNLLSVAVALFTLACSVQAISLGNIAGGIAGHRVHPPANPRPSTPAPGPTSDPECEVYHGALYSNRMIPLDKKWASFFGTGDPQGYTAGYGGSTLSLAVGPNIAAEKSLFLLHLFDPVSGKIKQLGYVVGKNQHCIAHEIPAVELTRNGNYWKVSVFAVGDGK